MLVNWSAIDAITAMVSTGAAAVCALFMMMIRLQISQIREEIAKARMEDREQMREWINGSFMRAGEVQSRLANLEGRLTAMERKG